MSEQNEKNDYTYITEHYAYFTKLFKQKSFESAAMINNGYFYTFHYDAIHKEKFVDVVPFIFCIGPYERVNKKGKTIRYPNIISGLNLHHMTVTDRYKLVNSLISNYALADDDSAHILSENTLNKLCPGVIAAVRYYDISHMYEVHKVRNAYVSYYLHEQGNILLSTPSEDALHFEFSSEIYKNGGEHGVYDQEL